MIRHRLALREPSRLENLPPFPTVSVITPSYNQGAFIEEAIRSIKLQSYPYIEHIIVDGGSDDNTIEILKKHKGTYNMRWVSEKDLGMYGAINKGIAMSKGSILSYLNSDDLYFPWTVETIVKHFAEDPSIGLVHGDLASIDLTAAEPALSVIFYPPFNLGRAIRIGSIVQPTAFWRRSVYEKIGGFDENLDFVGDYKYWIRVGSSFKVKKINEVLAEDRLHHTSKRFISRGAVDKERQEVKDKYLRSKHVMNYFLRSRDRIFSYFLRRYYMIRFLFAYFLSLKHWHSTKADWVNFLSQEGLRLSPWYRLLFGLILPVAKGKSFWVWGIDPSEGRI